MKTFRQIAREAVVFTLLGPIAAAVGYIGIEIYKAPEPWLSRTTLFIPGGAVPDVFANAYNDSLAGRSPAPDWAKGASLGAPAGSGAPPGVTFDFSKSVPAASSAVPGFIADDAAASPPSQPHQSAPGPDVIDAAINESLGKTPAAPAALSGKTAVNLADTVIYRLSSGHTATLPQSSVPALLKQDPTAKRIGRLVDYVPMMFGQATDWVPIKFAQQAMSTAGGELSVDMTDLNGKHWIIPFSQQNDAQKNYGYAWDDDESNATLRRYVAAHSPTLSSRTWEIFKSISLTEVVGVSLIFGWLVGFSIWLAYRVVRFAVQG